AGEAGEAGSTTKVCARRRRLGTEGNDGSNETGDGDSGLENAKSRDKRAIAEVGRWPCLQMETAKRQGGKEVCWRQKRFDRARRAGLIDADALQVVERDGVGVGVGVGVGCQLPLGSSLPTLKCQVKL
ncbi:hypothetical protein V493_04762, partial [Pseudogymnoascus sp. VKM F-4281 (FW-2241)]